MKKFVNAELVEVEINATAYGISNPENPDSEKTLKQNEDGKWGYAQEYGEYPGK